MVTDTSRRFTDPASVTIGPLRFAALTEQDVVDVVAAGPDRGGWVCPVNTDVLRQADERPEVASLVNSASLVVADGQPIVWLARLAGQPLPERVAGSTLSVTIPPALADQGRSLYLLGGAPGSAEGAAAVLRRDSPALRIVGTSCPPFGFESDPDEMARIRDDLRNAKPDVVFVALGFPKQDTLIGSLQAEFPDVWFLSCGISFSFITGDIRRAPGLVQRLGLEWVHRLVQEPKRLAKRYLVLDVPFALRMVVQTARRRAR